MHRGAEEAREDSSVEYVSSKGKTREIELTYNIKEVTKMIPFILFLEELEYQKHGLSCYIDNCENCGYSSIKEDSW